MLPNDIKKFSKQNLRAERNAYLSSPSYQTSSSITRRARALLVEDDGSVNPPWTDVAVKSPPNIVGDASEVEAFKRVNR